MLCLHWRRWRDNAWDIASDTALSLLAFATLGSMTKIEMILFVSSVAITDIIACNHRQCKLALELV